MLIFIMLVIQATAWSEPEKQVIQQGQNPAIAATTFEKLSVYPENGWAPVSSSESLADVEHEGTGRVMEITTQFFGGYLAGAAGGIILGIALIPAVTCPGYMGEAIRGFLIGATPGMILASSGSVYGIGQAWGRRNGSFGKTLLGASVPPLLGAVVGGTYRESGIGLPTGLLLGAFFGSFLSPVGAITGYHLSAQPKKSAAMPFERYSSSYLKNGDRTVIVPLLQIRF
jgi:hypothetical protein